ncbi:hypothetical protein BOTBODRAFT_391780 [Botryobasidium botryosum FD-172 SS1]|uniref:Secreted protein n=1 Tax=Botryobasidium botryosum (strain FD-172 SS1) TaxID=930990 RepID=A0A067N800_BOTB1|nr:hypothetical protein BOTBODRAFT_391780 [Botryobasidium botryosum FD-172 SS1]
MRGGWVLTIVPVSMRMWVLGMARWRASPVPPYVHMLGLYARLAMVQQRMIEMIRGTGGAQKLSILPFHCQLPSFQCSLFHRMPRFEDTPVFARVHAPQLLGVPAAI